MFSENVSQPRIPACLLNRKQRVSAVTAVVFVVFTLLAAGCGSDSNDSATTTEPVQIEVDSSAEPAPPTTDLGTPDDEETVSASDTASTVGSPGVTVGGETTATATPSAAPSVTLTATPSPVEKAGDDIVETASTTTAASQPQDVCEHTHDDGSTHSHDDVECDRDHQHSVKVECDEGMIPVDSDYNGVPDTCGATTPPPGIETTSTQQPSTTSTPTPAATKPPLVTREELAEIEKQVGGGVEVVEIVDIVEVEEDVEDVENGLVGDTKPVEAEGWYADPTCRALYRYWDGWDWTSNTAWPNHDLADDDGQWDDPLPSKKQALLRPPGNGFHCIAAQAEIDAFPCANPTPSDEVGVGIGGDGLPCATQILTFRELKNRGVKVKNRGVKVTEGSSSIKEEWADYDLPFVANDAQALGLITACMRAEPEWGYKALTASDDALYGRSVYEGCSHMWAWSVMPINAGGMFQNQRCVYQTIIRWGLHRWFYDGGITGWAEECRTWMDPVPERTTREKCHWLMRRYLGEAKTQSRIKIGDHACRQDQQVVDEFARLGHSYEYAVLAMTARQLQREAWELGFNPNNPEENGFSDGLNDFYPIFLDPGTKAAPMIW